MAPAANESPVCKLARLFPAAVPVRIPVSVSGGQVGGLSLHEKAVIEYGTENEVLFLSSLPLEFADRLHLRNTDGSLEADVSVVALQFHGANVVVAARFLGNVANWIVKS